MLKKIMPLAVLLSLCSCSNQPNEPREDETEPVANELQLHIEGHLFYLPDPMWFHNEDTVPAPRGVVVVTKPGGIQVLACGKSNTSGKYSVTAKFDANLCAAAGGMTLRASAQSAFPDESHNTVVSCTEDTQQVDFYFQRCPGLCMDVYSCP